MKKKYKIDSEIYSEDKIQNTISDFSEVTEIKYSKWELEIIWDTEIEIEEIFNEFMNYLISNINLNN